MNQKDNTEILSDLMSKAISGEISANDANRRSSEIGKEIVSGQRGKTVKSAPINQKEEKKKGCVYKRGRIYWIKLTLNGKVYYESSKSSDIHVAEKLLVRREIEAENNSLPNNQAEKTRFYELCADYIADYITNDRKSTARARQYVKHLKGFFKDVRVHGITTGRINEYIAMRKEKGISNQTVNNELSAFRRILNLGREQTPPKVLSIPYCANLQARNVRKGFFEADDFKALKAILPQYLKLLVTIAYYNGCRRGELLFLLWEQVNLADGYIRFEQADTKTDEPRDIYLNEETMELMLQQRRERDTRFPSCMFVFFNNDGLPIGSFDKVWKRACKKAGLVGKLFHDLRRTGVRNMIRAGVPEVVAMSISGHKTRSIFDRYNVTNSADRQKAARDVEKYVKDKLKEKSPFEELERLEKQPVSGG